MLVLDHFDKAVSRFPGRNVVVDGDIAMTYAEMSETADQVARALMANGVGPGSHVAILSPNHALVLACLYGLLRAGCVWIPANYRTAPADLAAQFDKLDVSWVFYHSTTEVCLEPIRSRLAGLQGAVQIDATADGQPSLLEWTAKAQSDEPFPRPQIDDVVLIASTGGTTGGNIKGVVHTHRTCQFQIATQYAIERYETPPVYLVISPMSHAAGMYHFGLMALGVTNVICPSTEPQAILKAIQDYRVTTAFMPPTVLYMLLSSPAVKDFDLSSLRQLTIGAAPVSTARMREAVELLGPVMAQAYGQTETLIFNMWMSPAEVSEAVRRPELAHRLASTGREGPFARVEIMDDAGVIVPIGERGEIVVRSGAVMREYYRDPERTHATCSFGWHHTGDIGVKDADGYIYIVDRKNDMIISGGFNVYPSEVEEVILQHPAVQDCAVVGVPHDKWGEMVLAAVELRPNGAIDEAEFLAFCRQRLGGVKCPKRVEILLQMPRSAVGKVLRRVVRDRFSTSTS